MAWRSHGKTNLELVSNLEKNGIIKSARVKQAMTSIDRADFISISPYDDRPQGISCNATISAPHMHAEALEALEPKLHENAKVLDVGSGSGYLTACFAKMIGAGGKAVGIEHMGELVKKSIENIRKSNADLLDSGRLEIYEGDGRRGFLPESPYDAIHVGAAAPALPTELIRQLKVGGRIIVPVGTTSQEFLQIDRISETETKMTKLLDVIYVPLTDKNYQLNRFG
uniref:Protein-L-isoaspartate O-methyltransferase n=1 Tax=Panagrolaimus sp. ES5 TaxID=591445 RepID=A0AC34FM00_9BILA